ncbi:MAG: hypothetical protein Q4C74_09030 [Rothia sp. (in: high G+C Gram-positive bacteria)]|nr:hypothetical protein [Rothia sp. (in: high G+C Gram-positive bacteria)]
MTTELKNWVPKKQSQLELGPARWNGTAIISDLCVGGSERLISIGLVERLILERVDGKKSVGDIEQCLQADGLGLPNGKLFTTLNKFAFFGVIERPFTVKQGTRQVDAQSRQAPSARNNQVTSVSRQRGILALWKTLPWLASETAFTLLAIFGIASFVALSITVPSALLAIKSSQFIYVAMGIFVAVSWLTLVTFTHENAHAAVFNAYSKREPYLALARFGILPMPNTHMPGISLMQPKHKVAVIAAGPLVSMLLATIPITLFWSIEIPELQTIAAICILIDVIIIGLSISFFPNTDATRILETISGVDQIQAVSFNILTRKYKLPSSLPGKTRVAVCAYPVLLLVAIGTWLAAVGWAIRLILN